jgi:hypothetical protein
MPSWIIGPLRDARKMLVGGDIEFENLRAVLREHLLEVIDQIIASRPMDRVTSSWTRMTKTSS